MELVRLMWWPKLVSAQLHIRIPTKWLIQIYHNIILARYNNIIIIHYIFVNVLISPHYNNIYNAYYNNADEINYKLFYNNSGVDGRGERWFVCIAFSTRTHTIIIYYILLLYT